MHAWRRQEDDDAYIAATCRYIVQTVDSLLLTSYLGTVATILRTVHTKLSSATACNYRVTNQPGRKQQGRARGRPGDHTSVEHRTKARLLIHFSFS